MTSKVARRSAWDAPLREPGRTSLASSEAVELESAKLDRLGVNRPIKDELELDAFNFKEPEVEQSETTDEETELNNHPRPKKGHGCWGHGPTLLALRKGTPKPFADGAGMCSPGRWPVARRKLPDNDLAK